ncbi:hypothetical protein [Thermococcus sp. JCM 11816]|uniref:hypothetical protein n=1 Tax=Thermococcus sp. (strain JCM 11816 / KS-1) TaxID=1295125 RepID=UPI000B1E0FEA
MDRVKLGDNVRIVNSIIGRHVEIGNNVRIVNSVIGDNAVIEDNVRMYNVKIWPHEFVERGGQRLSTTPLGRVCREDD